MAENRKRDYIFLMLVGVLFFLRGLQLQCIYPPLEGPDEYQHIAYMTYIEEQGQAPVHGKAVVPKSLYPHLLANPHCYYDWEQTRRVGCLRYKDFYEQQAVQTGDPNIPLYQAQHPPLYYVLASPMFAYIRDNFGFRPAVYSLRIINLALATIALICLVSPIKGILNDKRAARLSILAISLSPMFMTYVSRVANDVLALVFAGLAVNVLTRIDNQRYVILKAAIVGSLTGIGVLTKLIALCVLPVAVIYFIYFVFSSMMSFRKAVLCSTALIGFYLIFTLQYHLHSFRDFGTIFPAQQTFQNAAAGVTFLDLMANIRFSHLKNFFLDCLIQGNLWTSGWSALNPHKFFRITYNWFLPISIFGIVPYIISMIRNPPAKIPRPHPHIVLCILLVIFSFAAAYAHTLNAISAEGGFGTPTYYVMISYPALLICVLAAAGGYGKNGVPAAASILVVLFIVTEYNSLLSMSVQHWTGATDFQTIFERLARVHPVFPGPYFFFPLAVITCSLTVALMLKGFVADRKFVTG